MEEYVGLYVFWSLMMFIDYNDVSIGAVFDRSTASQRGVSSIPIRKKYLYSLKLIVPGRSRNNS